MDQLINRELNDEAAADDLIKIHDLLDTALNLRTEIELHRASQRIKTLNFFEKIDFLVDKGIDVRSQSWNALVNFRGGLVHCTTNIGGAALHIFAPMLKDRNETRDFRECLVHALNGMKETMQLMCFEDRAWGRSNE